MTGFKPVQGPIKIVFLGCGKIAASHAKTLRKFKNVELYFASREAEKAKDFSAKYKGKGFYDSYHTAIHSKEINVVFITTPPDLHLELAIDAMKAGKHVIVEKPPFLSSADFDTIDVLRKEHCTQLFVAENYFYKPVLQKLRAVLQSDVIGQVKFLFFNATKTQPVHDWRADYQKAGGGALFEGGIHWINFISNLGLTLQSVSGFQPGGRREQDMERSIQVVAEYGEGAIGTLFYSWEVNALLKGLRLSKIYGTEGSITFESNGLFIFVRGKKWKLIFPGLMNIGGVHPMFTDFFNALKTGTEAAFDFEKAKRDVQVIEQVYQSAVEKNTAHTYM